MHEFGLHVPVIAILPFVIVLGGIAILPLAAPHAWESNRNKAIFAALAATPVAVWLGTSFVEGLTHAIVEYLSFIALLGALYVISGGIHVSGDLQGTPGRNALILASGALIANLVGTTGASMLLLRPILRTNGQRKHKGHIPFFFILLVSNCGGLLTPLGDPPLFLGYLQGVPFTWTLGLFPYWLLAVGWLLGLFYYVDRRAYAREEKQDLARDAAEVEPIRVHGTANMLFLVGVIGAVFLPTPWREIVMVSMALASVFLGSRDARARNHFTYGPIAEVAILFAAIFITMVPALAILEARGGELGLREPWQFFLASGALSSVLDNAPTYLAFLSAAQGLGVENEIVGTRTVFLTAVSVGSVLMGANTYIGNGPNFMVKAVAEEAGYPMPSFAGYALRAIACLLPVYAIVALSLLE